jgi:hypothetical protein
LSPIALKSPRPAQCPRICGSVRREGEKHLTPPGRIFALTRKVLLLNDCLAWLVPRGKARARQG